MGRRCDPQFSPMKTMAAWRGRCVQAPLKEKGASLRWRLIEQVVRCVLLRGAGRRSGVALAELLPLFTAGFALAAHGGQLGLLRRGQYGIDLRLHLGALLDAG